MFISVRWMPTGVRYLSFCCYIIFPRILWAHAKDFWCPPSLLFALKLLFVLGSLFNDRVKVAPADCCSHFIPDLWQAPSPCFILFLKSFLQCSDPHVFGPSGLASQIIDSWGTNTLLCLRSFDSLGTNKFVFLRPFDSWRANAFSFSSFLRWLRNK